MREDVNEAQRQECNESGSPIPGKDPQIFRSSCPDGLASYRFFENESSQFFVIDQKTCKEDVENKEDQLTYVVDEKNQKIIIKTGSNQANTLSISSFQSNYMESKDFIEVGRDPHKEYYREFKIFKRK